MIVCFLLTMMLFSVYCGDDDDDDDRDDDDDDDDDAPDSYILTSGYGDRYYVFNGDNSTLIDAYEPLAAGMNTLRFATLIPSVTGPVAVFSAKPAEGGNAELFWADAFADTNLDQMTSLANEGLADTAPAYDAGVVFVGVKSGAIPEVLTMTPQAAEPSTYKSSSFKKNIGGDLCDTSEWASPAFSPGGQYFAAGWFCKDNEGPELPSYTTILVFDSDEEECGDPVFEREGYAGIQDVCFTYDSSMVIFSIGQPDLTLEVFAGKIDGSEEPIDVSEAFNGGDILNFDCDPTAPRVVFNDLSVNPNLYVMEYGVGDSITFEAPEQITTEGTFRRPRWVANPE